MKSCFLCGRNGFDDQLELHHIFPGKNRALSDRYGLTVYLCGNRCHRNGAHAAHRDKETRLYLSKWAQKKAMREQGWTIEEFRAVFGKNYLDEEEI